MKTNKVAIVTGGGSGLGFAIAKKMVSENITTIIAGRNLDKLKNAQKELGEHCHIYQINLTDLKAIPTFIDYVHNTFSRIDILVNNAGINQKKLFTDVTDEEFSNIINTNVQSVFAISREVAKHMIELQKGAIVNISSMASLYGIPKVISYTASKAAIDGMTRSMAVDLSPNGIRVNSVAPGFIYSDMSAKALDSDPERKAKVFGRTPMGRMGEPADIAEAVYFLASDAAKYITGVTLPVDGGNSIGF